MRPHGPARLWQLSLHAAWRIDQCLEHGIFCYGLYEENKRSARSRVACRFVPSGARRASGYALAKVGARGQPCVVVAAFIARHITEQISRAGAQRLESDEEHPFSDFWNRDWCALLITADVGSLKAPEK